MGYSFNRVDSIISINNNNDIWFIELNKNIEFFLSPEEFPLSVQFINSYNKKIVWESQLSPDCWCSSPSVRNKDLKISTKTNKVLYWIPYDRSKYFDLAEDVFCLYIATNNLKNGVVVGAGDGSYGEWINPLIEGLTKVLLIEPNKKEFEILYNDFRHYPNVNFLNKGIDVENAHREFFICPEWLGISSLIKENILNYKIEDKNILSEMIECESLNLLLKKDSYDWLRLDVEGLDSDLIFSLDEDVLNNLKYLQYEHINITEEEKINTNLFLEKHGFKTYVVGIDVVCIK
jgi:FkbM family methyltransferase